MIIFTILQAIVFVLLIPIAISGLILGIVFLLSMIPNSEDNNDEER